MLSIDKIVLSVMKVLALDPCAALPMVCIDHHLVWIVVLCVLYEPRVFSLADTVPFASVCRRLAEHLSQIRCLASLTVI